MSEEVITVDSANNSTNSTLAWANEWLGYLALGMFSMVLLVPTLGIVGLMVWEYFSDEAERKAERQKEIEEIMRERYSGKSYSYEPLEDEEEEVETTVRRRATASTGTSTDDFDNF